MPKASFHPDQFAVIQLSCTGRRHHQHHQAEPWSTGRSASRRHHRIRMGPDQPGMGGEGVRRDVTHHGGASRSTTATPEMPSASRRAALGA